MPYTMWTVSSDGDTLIGVRSGSPVGYLAYTLVLCGLAVWAAVMKDAEGETRVAVDALRGVPRRSAPSWRTSGRLLG